MLACPEKDTRAHTRAPHTVAWGAQEAEKKNKYATEKQAKGGREKKREKEREREREERAREGKRKRLKGHWGGG